jgi:hypothetical protein
MPTRRPRPPRPNPRRWVSWVGSVLVALLIPTVAANGLATTPFWAVVDTLLERFHATSRPCDLALGEGDVCFLVKPAQVAHLAAALEDFVGEQGGALRRGAWTSANGAHRVVLILSDEAWGSLELWLAERTDLVVEGWFERHPRPRP